MLLWPAGIRLSFRPRHSQLCARVNWFQNTHVTHRKHTPAAALKIVFSVMLLCINHVFNTPICPLPRSLQVSFDRVAQPTAYAAAVVSRVLSYQLTYFLSSQPLGPVYKLLPAEDVEYTAWKIDGQILRIAKTTNGEFGRGKPIN